MMATSLSNLLAAISSTFDDDDHFDQPLQPETNNVISNLCTICCQENQFFCYGKCNHPICLECGIRLRVVCEWNGCPICRLDLEKVIFVELPSTDPTFTAYDNVRITCIDLALERSRYGLTFEQKSAWEATRDILTHFCTICQDRPEFPDFAHLRAHIKHQHQLLYCDLCVDNLKLFSWERKCYRPDLLKQHQEKGDSDDRSHRGHPTCAFCHKLYVDNEHLYKHLRLDHFFCHFCENDGKNEFYADLVELNKHMKSDHFLCEKGDCKHEPFGIAFDCEKDLRRHEKEYHSSKKHQHRYTLMDFTKTKTSLPQSDWPSLGQALASPPRAAPLVMPIKKKKKILKETSPEESPVSSPENSTSTTSIGSKKAFVIIDDDEEFPSANEQMAAKKESKDKQPPKIVSIESTNGLISKILTPDSNGYYKNGFKKIYEMTAENLAAASIKTTNGFSSVKAKLLRIAQEKQNQIEVKENIKVKEKDKRQIDVKDLWKPEAKVDKNCEALPVVEKKSIPVQDLKPAPQNIEYFKPRHFDKRNRALLEQLKMALRYDTGRIDAFKKRSLEFRQGQIEAMEFCVWMQVLFDDDTAYANLFNELLGLLPDIDCQQRLRDAFKNLGVGYCDESTKKCGKCGQWLLKVDFFEHSTDAHKKNA